MLSGKTTVLIQRVRRLIDLGADPGAILLLTFTNNAAKTMLDRLDGAALLACTFHSFCYRILREYLPEDRRAFTVLDQEDLTKLLKGIMTDMSITLSPANVVEYIGLRKSKGEVPTGSTTIDRVYQEYERRRIAQNVYDFGSLQVDALLYAPSIVGRYKHVLIDEYHDTDPVQWELTKVLAEGTDTLTVVCDDQQSIYGWRGADIQNILRFPQYFPSTEIINLSDNFRSTPEIVDVVNRVVKCAKEKLCDKDLVSKRSSGVRPIVQAYDTDRAEARGIVDMIAGTPPGDNMILYRANWQSRVFEEELTRRRIRYRVVDSVGFYRRREVKDILAYMRLIYNPLDEAAASRIINVPPRGIGRKTVESAVLVHGTLCNAILLSSDPKISKVRSILSYIRGERQPPATTMESILSLTKYLEYIQEDKRVDNIKSLVGGAASFGGTMEDYMLMVSLLSNEDAEEGTSQVRLLTIHSAKGMEAKHVYVVGVEDDLLPHNASEDIEEERRLLYVAVSRAMDTLVVSYTKGRWRYTKFVPAIPSRFIEEVRNA
jgi:DNA helicase-2/ATP-dependent DNA helicase PcrA